MQKSIQITSANSVKKPSAGQCAISDAVELTPVGAARYYWNHVDPNGAETHRARLRGRDLEVAIGGRIRDLSGALERGARVAVSWLHHDRRDTRGLVRDAVCGRTRARGRRACPRPWRPKGACMFLMAKPERVFARINA